MDIKSGLTHLTPASLSNRSSISTMVSSQGLLYAGIFVNMTSDTKRKLPLTPGLESQLKFKIYVLKQIVGLEIFCFNSVLNYFKHYLKILFWLLNVLSTGCILRERHIPPLFKSMETSGSTVYAFSYVFVKSSKIHRSDLTKQSRNHYTLHL